MLWLNALGALLSAQEQTFYLEEWHATEGEQAESIDRLVSVTDASSNLYVAGSQLNQYGKYDLLLTKYDNTGYELWPTTFNVTDTTGNVVVGDMALSSGYVIITGTVYNWEAVYDGSLHEDDAPRGIAVDGSGNVYVAGYTTTANGKDFTVIKYNSSGAQQWAKLVDGAAGQDDEARAITVDEDGNAVAAGYATENSSRDFYTTILDPSDGSTTWSAAFNGLANKNDEASQVLVDSTGSIVVLGKGQTDHPEVTAYTTVRYAKRSLLLPHEEAFGGGD